MSNIKPIAKIIFFLIFQTFLNTNQLKNVSLKYSVRSPYIFYSSSVRKVAPASSAVSLVIIYLVLMVLLLIMNSNKANFSVMICSLRSQMEKGLSFRFNLKN